MDKIDSWDWTMAFSLIAYVSSKIAMVATDESKLSLISTVSAVIFSITAFIKLLDLIFEKAPKWIAIYKQWKKPKEDA